VSESQNSISSKISKFQTSLDRACGVKSLIISNLSLCLQAELLGKTGKAREVILQKFRNFCENASLDADEVIKKVSHFNARS
jgi:hypothetical protein